MTKEQERYKLQLSLDSQKSDKDRNKLGQFSTPYTLAKEMVRHALSYIDSNDIHFLEPSIGTGVFYSALRETASPLQSVGFEIDEHYFKPTKEFWNDAGINLIHGDFLSAKPNPEFNLILANPPYCRHHHIDRETKRRLQARILKEYGIHISGLSGLYCYFLILSTLWLTDDGISSWLIPSEFLDVNYGAAVKEFLCSKVELISIHKFNPADLQFSDALVSSSVVTFRKRRPHNNMVRFSVGSNLNDPASISEIPLDSLSAHDKWSPLFETDTNNISHNGRRLGEYFKVSRGVSTGNNSFFIIPKGEVIRKSLPLEFLTPILPAPRYLNVEKIEADFTGIEDKDRYYLLSCPLPIDIIEHKYPQLYKYIKDGEINDMNSSYNCQRRSPWYLCETRQPAPYYMTYMGRGDGNARMFRFILNESDSIVTNSYLILYPKDIYKHSLKNKKTVESVWKILNEIPKERLAKCGRAYGGGLFKIEPKELESLIIPELDTILCPNQGNLFEFDEA